MVALLGIDCATTPEKTGLALGELHGNVVCILRCAIGTKKKEPADIAIEWLTGYEQALIALDAPLGWPRKLGTNLFIHQAGLPLQTDADQLFRRTTDVAIKERLNKQPLEVGANLIARTAVAALKLLNDIRDGTNRPIPLAWAPKETEPWRAIEVYPAAIRIAHNAHDAGGSLEGLNTVLDCSAVSGKLLAIEHVVDAAVCALAAADFLCGRALPPRDDQKASALIEGWIWAPDSPKQGKKA